VVIDGGIASCRVTRRAKNGWQLQVTHAPPKGLKLRAEKGLNFPGTALKLPALTERDREDLSFVAKYADLVGYSFVQRPSDVYALQDELVRRGRAPESLGLILKIETAAAVRALPALLVAALARQPVGVLIARGDLAAELGFERLPEIQEELLWLCEAAHVPVIWATQVLERLVRKGTPTRAEVTDAAAAARAECVMLNKGPYLREALRTLDQILTSMRAHQDKKTAQLAPLPW
jgi:pyruvate kinase